MKVLKTAHPWRFKSLETLLHRIRARARGPDSQILLSIKITAEPIKRVWWVKAKREVAPEQFITAYNLRCRVMF